MCISTSASPLCILNQIDDSHICHLVSRLARAAHSCILLYTVVNLLKAPAMICPLCVDVFHVYLLQFARPLSARYTFTRRILHIPCSCVPRPCAAICTSLFCTFRIYASGTQKSPNLFLIFCGNVGKSVIKWQNKERNRVRNRKTEKHGVL